jgi:hypothetical protein
MIKLLLIYIKPVTAYIGVLYTEHLFDISQDMLHTTSSSACHESLMEYFAGTIWDIIPVINLLFYLLKK